MGQLAALAALAGLLHGLSVARQLVDQLLALHQVLTLKRSMRQLAAAGGEHEQQQVLAHLLARVVRQAVLCST